MKVIGSSIPNDEGVSQFDGELIFLLCQLLLFVLRKDDHLCGCIPPIKIP